MHKDGIANAVCCGGDQLCRLKSRYRYLWGSWFRIRRFRYSCRLKEGYSMDEMLQAHQAHDRGNPWESSHGGSGDGEATFPSRSAAAGTAEMTLKKQRILLVESCNRYRASRMCIRYFRFVSTTCRRCCDETQP